MSSRVIQIDTRTPAGQDSALEIFQRSKLREEAMSRLLVFYILAGLAFMLLPGTFLGVWNLIHISNRHAADSISAPWIQAHGHAQFFGWIGTFILGIGFHSIPSVRSKFALNSGWLCGVLWVTGVALRWTTNVYLWQWRAMLPLSAAMELAAFLIFFRAVSQHDAGSDSQDRKKKLDSWVWVVVVGTLGFLATLLMNLGASVYLALRGSDPAFPSAFNQRFLVMCGWGFLVPFVWGFASKWLPTFLGLRALNARLLWTAVAINTTGVIAAQFGMFRVATVVLLIGAVFACAALRIFEPAQQAAKTKGVHGSFPYFVRSAFGWLVVAAALGIWAARAHDAAGIWGASRHALTVGFIAIMVFNIGQRVLPAFSGMKLLFSPRIMFACVSLLSIGCALRVSSEILSYQEISQFAWKVLPVSAVLELTGVTLFAVNLVITFMQRPAHLQKASTTWPTAELAYKEKQRGV